MTVTFSVKNFERFQHYKDRSPPWIKLYNELLDDYTFGLLPDASKLHLVAIWLLASRSNNRIPHDPGWIAKRISATEKVDLELLRSSGFIEVQDAGVAQAARKPDADPERESQRQMQRQRIRPARRTLVILAHASRGANITRRSSKPSGRPIPPTR
jgi:hypothetical protein